MHFVTLCGRQTEWGLRDDVLPWVPRGVGTQSVIQRQHWPGIGNVSLR